MTSFKNAIALQRTFHLADVRNVVPKVRCPTLVLNVRGDPIVPFEQGRLVAALIPGARLVPLESRNHLVVDTEPAWAQLVKAIDEFLPTGPPRVGPHLGGLSSRESEVLELVAQGLSNRAIAERLGIAEKTVRNHVTAVLGKLGVNSRAQAIVSARDAGFGQRLDS
jgi:DNA-binding NarL/FixJ family response regulator